MHYIRMYVHTYVYNDDVHVYVHMYIFNMPEVISGENTESIIQYCTRVISITTLYMYISQSVNLLLVLVYSVYFPCDAT